MVFTILGRRTSLCFNEFADKVITVPIPDIRCDLIDLFIRTDKLTGRFIDPIVCQVIFERLVIFLPEDLAQVRTVNVILLPQIP